jgi:hypothetical protein
VKPNWTALKMKLTASLLMALLLPSCACFDWAKESRENESALYDPPTVHLIEGEWYFFEEGVVIGRGQKMHSHYSYRQAAIIGSGK